MANIIFTPKDILEQDFKTKMRGYDPIEVDEFLDDVIKDYEAYSKELLKLKEENDRLKAKIEQLQKAKPAQRTQAEPVKSAAVTNFDILKRLSNLENEVFGKKLDQEKRKRSTNRKAYEEEEFKSNYSQAEDNDDIEKTRQF